MRPHAVRSRPAAHRAAALLLTGAVATAVLAGCGGGEEVTTVPGGPATDDADTPVTSGPATSDPSRTPPISVTVPTTGKPTPTQPAATGVATEADLTVVVDDGAGQSTTWTLTCDGTEVGGTLPTAAQACATLAEVGARAFEEPPADRACTEIYGGPQTATITGTFAGAPVQDTLSRTDGCEISRWDELSALVGPAGDPDS